MVIKRKKMSHKSFIKRFLLSGFIILVLFSFVTPALAWNPITALINAYKAYVSPAPVAPVVAPSVAKITPAPVNSPVVYVAPARNASSIAGAGGPQPVTVSDAALTSALERILNNPNIAAQLRGPQGVQGPSGSNGISSIQSSSPNPVAYMPVGVTYADPSHNFTGGTYETIANLSSNLFTNNVSNITTLNVAGDSTLKGGLSVAGSSNVTGDLGIGGTATIPTLNATTLNVAGISTLTGGLSVTGNSTLTGNLNVTGHQTIEGVTSTGATGTGNLVFSGSPSFTGTIKDTGATTTGPDFEVGLTGDTVNRVAIGLNTTDVPRLSFGPGNANRDLFLERAGAANLRFGAPDSASPVAQTLSVQNVIAGTSNTAGAALTIAGSQGTGTGLGGIIQFKTAPAGTTGTSVNTLSPAMTILGNGNVGIGTTSPYGVVNIYGNGNSTATGPLLTLGSPNTYGLYNSNPNAGIRTWLQLKGTDQSFGMEGGFQNDGIAISFGEDFDSSRIVYYSDAGNSQYSALGIQTHTNTTGV